MEFFQVLKYHILNYFENLIFVHYIFQLVSFHYNSMISFQNNDGKWSVDFLFTKIYFHSF